MFCLYTSSKLSRPKFEFSLKVKVMGSNPGYLLKSFLLYFIYNFASTNSMSDDSLKPSHPSSPGGSGGGQYIPAQGQPDPIVMPGFPVRTLQAHPPPPYSPSR